MIRIRIFWGSFRVPVFVEAEKFQSLGLQMDGAWATGIQGLGFRDVWGLEWVSDTGFKL